MNTVARTRPLAPWLDALHASSQRLAAATDPLTDAELTQPSFADRWSIAQVLSHLGSAAGPGPARCLA